MYLLIVFFPLIGSFITGIFGRKIGKQGAVLITTTLVALSTLLSFFIFYEVVLSHSICTIKLFR